MVPQVMMASSRRAVVGLGASGDETRRDRGKVRGKHRVSLEILIGGKWLPSEREHEDASHCRARA